MTAEEIAAVRRLIKAADDSFAADKQLRRTDAFKQGMGGVRRQAAEEKSQAASDAYDAARAEMLALRASA